MTRHWLEAVATVRGGVAESVAEFLIAAGALAVDMADSQAGEPSEQPIWGEPGTSPQALWPECRVAALFEGSVAPETIETLWSHARTRWPGLIGATSYRLVADDDWVRATQAQFAPIEITPRLWIVPTWCEPPNPAAINLRIDPGMAFGTGAHATTALCLRWLCTLELERRCLLDYGTGSGVLALAARALGAETVLGVDIDPVAIETARRNAEANAAIAPAVSFELVGDEQEATRLGRWDVVIANILAGPLAVLAPLLASRVAPGGWLALSGILEQQADSIAEAYQPWLSLSVAERREGWVLMVGRAENAATR
ncbi:MAG: 50S ribosomal protein L11 methyltransferase [Casimicrobiaceae bacterium]|nr:50S ribosomal protein L11 methyltransferase [Casimicrobiaceae bacterium]MDW8312095.1 50S ribosomal protein L11 methyltransferase [Burkholderiales bacterium]